MHQHAQQFNVDLL